MCGIIGYIGPKDVVPVLIDGLRRLEYRGYDSAGVAVVRDGSVDLRRSAGKLSNLEQVIDSDPITGGGDRVFRTRVPGAADQAHVTIEGGGHFLQEDRGAELGAVLVDFIAATS